MGQCLTRQKTPTKYLHVPLELTCMLNFKFQALVKRSFKGCQPRTKHFPSIWPWLLMSRMVNILLGLFILLPFCSLSCIHRMDIKAIFSDTVFHWQKERKKKVFFHLDLCPRFTVGEAKCSPGSFVIYPQKTRYMVKLSLQSNQLFQK